MQMRSLRTLQSIFYILQFAVYLPPPPNLTKPKLSQVLFVIKLSLEVDRNLICLVYQ